MFDSIPHLIASATSDETPFWVKTLAAVGITTAAIWMNKTSTPKAKADVAQPPPLNKASPETAAPLSTPAAEAEVCPPSNPPDQQNFVQKAFAFPGVGSMLSTVVGIFVPLALYVVLIPVETRRATYGMVYLFSCLGIWNLAFTLLSQVRITFFFLPLWLVSLIGIGYSIYEVRAGK